MGRDIPGKYEAFPDYTCIDNLYFQVNEKKLVFSEIALYKCLYSKSFGMSRMLLIEIAIGQLQ
ncbi:MAG: hypothetical protein D6728_04275 [Cyanobacteria bacterium J055]|nr:MAG: hypothetical protein D6728_04275 [Cyanobacteria bacterium J055]